MKTNELKNGSADKPNDLAHRPRAQDASETQNAPASGSVQRPVLPSFDSISLSQQQVVVSSESPQPIQTAPLFLESMTWVAHPQKLSMWSRLAYGTRWLWRQWRCLIWLRLTNLKVSIRNYRTFGRSYGDVVREKSNLLYGMKK